MSGCLLNKERTKAFTIHLTLALQTVRARTMDKDQSEKFKPFHSKFASFYLFKNFFYFYFYKCDENFPARTLKFLNTH